MRSGVEWSSRPKAIAAFVGYTLASFGVALAIHPAAPHQGIGTAWIILMMLVAVSVCMVTERALWGIWRRFLAVPGSWFAHAVLHWPAAAIGRLFYSTGFPELVDYVSVYLATVPIVLWAMWHSRLFVAATNQSTASSSPGLADGAEN